MKKYITRSETETKKLAERFAQKFSGRVITLTGELGAGKTTFVQGFARGLGIKEKIISPTFVLIRQHKIPNSSKALFHIDLYRLDDISHIDNLGLKEILENPDNIVIIEWPEKIKKFLPKNPTWITFETSKDNKREIIAN
ncbi:MAG: UPF0079 ATP-binding protein [Microgenomates group bacterium Gr01-1014_7]|nr:MAG: UPF0079 ATP-binding protein [Microgenomates group bacterium Gr01-1014_7]